MLIILEGCDGSGKTTLAGQLSDYIIATQGGQVEVLHRGPLNRHPVLEYELDLQAYRPGTGRHLICDRWHLGELVYGPLLRGESRLDPASLLHIELFLKTRGALLVYLQQQVSVLHGRLVERGDDLISGAQLDEVTAAYDHVMDNSTTLSRMELSGSLVGGHVQHIIARARSLEYTCNKFDYTSFTGDPTCTNLLLVGEHLGGSAQGCTSAFVPLPSSSGRYLLEALLAAASLPGERCIAFTNAGTDDVLAQWETLGKPPTVLLGEVTRKLIDFPRAGLVPHPQYIRRFRYDHLNAYGQALWEAAIKRTDLRDRF